MVKVIVVQNSNSVIESKIHKNLQHYEHVVLTCEESVLTIDIARRYAKKYSSYGETPDHKWCGEDVQVLFVVPNNKSKLVAQLRQNNLLYKTRNELLPRHGPGATVKTGKKSKLVFTVRPCSAQRGSRRV